MSEFKKKYDFDHRVKVAQKVLKTYPERVPLIVEKATTERRLTITKSKFLEPSDITIGKMMYEVRKHMPNLYKEEALFLFVNNTMPATSTLLATLYQRYKEDDGFLYVTFSGENAFGDDLK